MSLPPYTRWKYALAALICGLAVATAGGETSRHEAGLRRQSQDAYTEQPGSAQRPMRILPVGDSMTHMRDGDYTWRYRLWQWFKENNVDVQFVGPYTSTGVVNQAIPPIVPAQQQAKNWHEGANFEGGYAHDADPDFLANNTGHFSAAGGVVRDSKEYIAEVLQLHPADMMLVMMGVNDLAFCCHPPDTIENVGKLIANARSVVPNIKIVIASVPYSTFLKRTTSATISYNGLLPAAVRKWNTPESPVGLADVAKNYDCGNCACADGFDGLHPNAMGDYHIAYSFSETLVNDFGMAPCPIVPPLQGDPRVERYLPAPSNWKMWPSEQGVTGSWDAVYGAYSYLVEVTRDNEPPEIIKVPNNYWASYIRRTGSTYSVRVAAYAQNTTGAWTDPQSAVAMRKRSSAASTETPITPLLDTTPETIFRRQDAEKEEGAGPPCVGGTAPIPKPCTPSSQFQFGSTARLAASKLDFTHLILFCFILATVWFGFKKFSPKRLASRVSAMYESKA